MSAYTIKSVGEPKPWSNDFGSFLSYPVDLEDEQGAKHLGVEWNRKSDSKAPQVEDRIAGHIEPGQYADKLKVDYEATKELKGGGGSTSSSGGTHYGKRSNWKPEAQYDPEKVARIGRAHAQNVAVAFYAANHAPTVEPWPVERLKEWISWFEADVNAAAKAAQGSGGAPPQSSPGPVQTPATHEEFHGLLEKAGLNCNAARVVTDYALTHITVEEQDAALSMLENPDRAQAALGRLSDKAVAHYGSPLPSADPDDDIPFRRPEYDEPLDERLRWRR